MPFCNLICICCLAKALDPRHMHYNALQAQLIKIFCYWCQFVIVIQGHENGHVSVHLSTGLIFICMHNETNYNFSPVEEVGHQCLNLLFCIMVLLMNKLMQLTVFGGIFSFPGWNLGWGGESCVGVASFTWVDCGRQGGVGAWIKSIPQCTGNLTYPGACTDTPFMLSSPNSLLNSFSVHFVTIHSSIQMNYLLNFRQTPPPITPVSSKCLLQITAGWNFKRKHRNRLTVVCAECS